MLFAEFEVNRQSAVELHRRAVVAQGEAQIALVKQQQLQQKFLMEAAKSFNEVAVEPIWFIFRKEGDIVLESPFTERTQRNLARAQLAQLEQQTQQDEYRGQSGDDMYEADDDSEDEGHGGKGEER